MNVRIILKSSPQAIRLYEKTTFVKKNSREGRDGARVDVDLGVTIRNNSSIGKRRNICDNHRVKLLRTTSTLMYI